MCWQSWGDNFLLFFCSLSKLSTGCNLQPSTLTLCTAALLGKLYGGRYNWSSKPLRIAIDIAIELLCVEIVRGTEWSIWSLWKAQNWIGHPHPRLFDEELIRILQDTLRGLVIGPRQVQFLWRTFLTRWEWILLQVASKPCSGAATCIFQGSNLNFAHPHVP